MRVVELLNNPDTIIFSVILPSIIFVLNNDYHAKTFQQKDFVLPL